MREKRGARVAVLAGIACVLALVGVVVAGIVLWHPWDGTSPDPAADDVAVQVSDVEAEGARGETTGSDDAVTREEEIVYTDGGSGTREERAEFANLDPKIASYQGTTLVDSDALNHASKAFIFMGTVMGSEEVGVARNRFEVPMGLTVAVDRVYSGEAFAEGDAVSMFFPISRFVGDSGLVTQYGPRMEAGRSYVFFCDLPEDALVQSWLDDRYPESPGLADGFDLVVSWDAYCFPIKEGLVCAWMGIGWSSGKEPSIALNDSEARMFNKDRFYDLLDGGNARPPASEYYNEDEFGLALEGVRNMAPWGLESLDSRSINPF